MNASRDDIPQKVKQQIRTQKFMLTVIWGIKRFQVICLMTEQHIYITQYLLSHILEPLSLALFPEGLKPHSHRLNLHLYNCCVHRSKAPDNIFAENSMIRVPHPPDSLDLVLSDFWLFGYMKVALAGQQFPGPKDLRTGIQEFLSETQRPELELVFHHWIERAHWVLDNHGDQFHE
jgi:hypothetical protein